MKPLATYTALLGLTFFAAGIATALGFRNLAIAEMILGAMTALAFQGRIPQQAPLWAEGVDFPLPKTSHIVAMTVLVQAAGITLTKLDPTVGMVGRGCGFFVLMAAIGKVSRDYEDRKLLHEGQTKP